MIILLLVSVSFVVALIAIFDPEEMSKRDTSNNREMKLSLVQEKKDAHKERVLTVQENKDVYKGRVFTVDELELLGDDAGELILEMARGGHFLSIDDLIKLRITDVHYTAKYEGWQTLQLMASKGCEFTTDQIIQFGFFPYWDSERDLPLSIWMVKSGHYFNIDEIIRLGNPNDRWGATLAHWQARYGYQFEIDDLIRLGDCRIHFKDDDVVWTDYSSGNMYWTIADISVDEQYDRKTELLHNGATVAQIMAREGYKFTDEEIERLGNPRDAAGLSLKDWMERAAAKAENRNS